MNQNKKTDYAEMSLQNIILMYILYVLYYWIVKTDALMWKQCYNAEAGQCAGDFNYFKY